MKLRSIKLQTINPDRIRFHLKNFFRNTKFTSKYIDLITRVCVNDTTIIHTLGSKATINHSVKSERDAYVNNTIAQFVSVSKTYTETKKSTSRPFRLDIYYFDSNEDKYNKYINKLLNSENFNI